MHVLQRKTAACQQRSERRRLSLPTPDGEEPTLPSSPELSELALVRLIHEREWSALPDVALSRSVALLLTLRPEVIRVSVLTGICASAANVLRDAPDLRAARALTRFYPVGSSCFILASTRYRRLDPNSAAAIALNAFNDALTTAMDSTLRYTADRQGARDLGTISSSDLSQSWQSACTAALHLLGEIDTAITPFNPIGCAAEGDVLIDALKAAAAGGSPLRSVDGDFVMPAWVEQRQSPRITVSCKAGIIVGPSVSTIRITDMSTGGIGIETSEYLKVDETIMIQIGEIILPGKVIWRRGDRAGIALDQDLLDDSPVYRFLSGHPQAR